MNSDILSHSEIGGGWWNLPKQGYKRVISLLTRRSIPTHSLNLYIQIFEQARQIGVIAQSCDQKQFSNKEFLSFVKLRNDFAEEIGEFAGLKECLRLFRVAIEAKNSFLKIEQIELLYRSSKQQEFYNLVFEMLSENVDKNTFYKKVHQRLNEMLDIVKTESGKQAVKSYVAALDTLSQQDELGLRLLYLFKKHQLTNYSILKTASDLVTYLEEKNLQDLELVIGLVKANHDVFSKVGQIIGVPLHQDHPKTYSRMVQYVALRHKYKGLYYQFKKLKKVLYKWYGFHKILGDIRNEYPVFEYKQPKELKASIPGLEVYNKYKDYLK